MQNFSIVILLALLPAAAQAECASEDECAGVIHVMNFDQAPHPDSHLQAFLDGLSQALKERDIAYIDARLASDAMLGFGTEERSLDSVFQSDGGAAFQELVEILRLKGNYVSTGDRPVYCVPYFYAAFPEELDAYQHQVITGSGVSAYDEPGLGSARCELPAYSVVRTDPGMPISSQAADGSEWVRIFLGDSTAFVRQEVLYSPIGSRMCVIRRDGQWSISALVVGD